MLELEGAPAGSGITSCSPTTTEDAVATWCDAVGETLKDTGVLANAAGQLAAGNSAYLTSGIGINHDDEDIAEDYEGFLGYYTIEPPLAGLNYAYGVMADIGITYNTPNDCDFIGAGTFTAMHAGSGNVQHLTGVTAQVICGAFGGDVTDKIVAVETYVSGTSGGSPGTVAKAYGVRVTSPVYATNITNLYGIYVENQGATRYAVFANGGKFHITGLPAYANNAAALAGGLVAGDLYRTNGDPDLVCVVH